ncbi:MAG: phosphoribosyltransferase [Rhizobiales bacterium]|nr:phosphoribosyltransferase [Hyphomicrobiales bacterium]MBO6697492.1 phosphoribosyltransferase [Hyphomicrobiales bacterium]MBO6736253.1 phosphoribosyltransferase [Hyphomicrobiales bacterium]MBO6912723.1 phosphoribosyltransferase [Hyphomicrobiales bacterium]MBO6953892.1 phosphoribosyltransferase [Hyphomicrobiales bacterium]
MTILPLQNRSEAGRRLAARLIHLKSAQPLVLGLPRGGVPVAVEIAEALDAPLEPMFAKKIGAPDQPELAIGAVADGANPELVLNRHITRQLRLSSDYVREQMEQKLNEIAHRRAEYLGQRTLSDPSGRTVILVDDGIATGCSVKAALAALRHANPARLVLAVPVLPSGSVVEFEALCDELVYLAAPTSFGSVGAHYLDFGQVDDAAVIDMLNRHAVRASA